MLVDYSPRLPTEKYQNCRLGLIEDWTFPVIHYTVVRYLALYCDNLYEGKLWPLCGRCLVKLSWFDGPSTVFCIFK
jgi:hypothetical protein